MTRDQLKHAIRAACQVAKDSEVLVFGSQAILGSYPDAPESLRTSIEVDIQPRNQPDNTDLVDGSLGELSMFHHTHGFYVHGVSIDAAVLPSGWESRTIAVAVADSLGRDRCMGFCLEAHDLAASKLVAARDKDRAFVVTLLVEGLIDPATLLERIAELPGSAERRASIAAWTASVSAELHTD